MFLFDPFIQQILSYPTREAASPTNSGTAVAPWITFIPSPYLSEFTLALDGRRVSFFNLLAHPELHLVYLQSLEVCSRCINVTDSAMLNCTMASSSDNTTTGHAKSLFRKATHWRQPLTISQNNSARPVTFSYTERIIWEGFDLLQWWDQRLSTTEMDFANATLPITEWVFADVGYDYNKR